MGSQRLILVGIVLLVVGLVLGSGLVASIAVFLLKALGFLLVAAGIILGVFGLARLVWPRKRGWL